MTESLTKHKEGSVRELWTVAYPMILSFLSGNLMMFADRLFLAKYSIAAMNSAAAAGTIVIIFQYGAASITSITEVFVGQFNGAGVYHRAAASVWQMLWLSLFMFIFFLIAAYWGGPFLLPGQNYETHALPYYQWMLYFGAATPAIATLSSFFIGIGKTRTVMAISILGCCLNIILDPLLIFGVEGFITPMGTKGAAIATGTSLITQLFAFWGLFLSRQYRDKYKTHKCCLDPSLFFYCIKIGLPNAIGYIIESSAWAVSIHIMAAAGELYLTIAAIGQSIYAILSFSFEGIQKAVTALTANKIKTNDTQGIFLIWRSGLNILLLSAIPLGILVLGYPNLIITQFVSTYELSPENTILLSSLLKTTAIGVFLYYLFDGFSWICCGTLTAAEDTWFIMWICSMNAWIFGLSPIFLFVSYLKWSPAWYFFALAFYAFLSAVAYYIRLETKPWFMHVPSKSLSFSIEATVSMANEPHQRPLLDGQSL